MYFSQLLNTSSDRICDFCFRFCSQAAVSVNIVYGDKVIWEKGLGVLNKTEQPPQSPNSRTMYPCASVSKVLTVCTQSLSHSYSYLV